MPLLEVTVTGLPSTVYALNVVSAVRGDRLARTPTLHVSSGDRTNQAISRLTDCDLASGGVRDVLCGCE